MSQIIAGILLAAGKSRRFGANKLTQVLPATGVTMIEQSARKLLRALPHSVAVIPANAEAIKQLLDAIAMPWIENRHAEDGISSSIHCGMAFHAASDFQPKAWVVALADMPYLSVSSIEGVVAALRQGSRIVAPFYQQQRGHPVGFSSAMETNLHQLRGDSGARNILIRHVAEITQIPVDDQYVLYDVDCPQQII